LRLSIRSLRPPPTPSSAATAIAAGILSGILLDLANPPADAGPVAFVALVPLLWALLGGRPRRAGAAAFAFGLVYYGLLLNWLVVFGTIAWLPLVVSQALFAAAFGALAPLVTRADRPMRSALALAGLWTAIDWVRGMWPIGGFTWGGLGYTQHGNGLTLPLATVTGVWGVTFVVLLVNGLLLEALVGRRSGRAARLGAAVPVAIALAVTVLPALIPVAGATGAPMDVAVVQGNVPRALASDRLLQGDQVALNHIDLNRTLASKPPDLAVWPENALSEDPAGDSTLGAAVSDSIRAVGAPTIVGAIKPGPGGTLFNVALLYDEQGRIVDSYAKIHLVPFGEYIPWRGAFGWTQRYRHGLGTFSSGTRVHLFDVNGTFVGTPICFENTFPGLFRQFVAKGAQLMVVTTNDSSYLDSPASREHVIMSQLRAVETGRWVVQAAVSGESAIVNAHGQVVSQTGLFQQTILRREVPTSTARTIYVRVGDWFPVACMVILLLLIGLATNDRVAARRRRDGKTADPDGGPPAGEGIAATRAPIAGGAEARVLVVLPTYNERATIEAVVRGVLKAGPSVHALIVDDGSPDGTGKIADDLAASETRVRVLHREGKRGLSSAYLTGFHVGLEDGYDVIVEMDADLSHRPEDLPRVIAGAEVNDLTVGSRYIPGGGVSNWSRFRVLLSKGGNLYARTLLRLPVKDATSGFRSYRRGCLAALVAGGFHSQGYGFQIELVYRAQQMGFALGEVPITFREREHGHSKISRAIIIEALYDVARWAIRDRLPGHRSS
jgi:apolipoprotein N-acyltransferase